jgi:hypothetical protein
MHREYIFLILGVAVIFAGPVTYALYRNIGVKALFKIPFAAFSFETTARPDDKSPKEGVP